MTITLLAAHKDGQFVFSGHHQNIIIFRKETGKIESIKTDGMWLGMVDDIADMVKDDELKLNVGDAGASVYRWYYRSAGKGNY